MKNRIFITGATGFVGSHLARALVSNGENVSILVRNKKLNNRLGDIADKLHIYEGDLQSNSLANIVDKVTPTVVFHIAAYGALPGQKVTIDDLLETNVKGVIRLIDAVKKHKIKLFVNTGSSSEYGLKKKPMKESDLLLPINDYGVTKAAATHYCQKVSLTESLPIVTLRLFSPYGYEDDDNRLIPFVIQKALKNEPISLSAKNNVRDFVAIDDVVSAYLQLMNSTVNPGEIINIGSGKQHSVYDIVSLIIKLSKSESVIQWNTKPLQQRQIEPKIWQADIKKAKEILGWKPHYSLEQGLTKTIEQYKKQSYD